MGEYISLYHPAIILCFSDLPRLTLGGLCCNDMECNVCLLLRLAVTLGVPFPWIVDYLWSDGGGDCWLI